MKNGKTKGIILKTNLFQEADLGVQVLLVNGSKKDFVAKHALKSKKRFAGGVLEPSHFVELSWKESSAGISYLEEARIIESFEGLRSSYESLQSAMEGIKLVSQVSKEGLEQEEVFHMLGNYLRLCSGVKADRKIFLHFKVRLLTTIGVLPFQEEFAVFQQTPLAQSESIKVSAKSLQEIEGALRPYKEDYL